LIIDTLDLEHPTQASRVRLAVFQTAQGQGTVDGLPAAPGYLVTEDRLGAGKVVSTLGFYPDREAAVQKLRDRSRQLQAQRYRPVASA
jgi:hypothetical protein